MEAQNRLLPNWFDRIRSGQLRLPRFQRYEAWGPNEVASILEAMLRGLPAGAALILQVGDKEIFKSRTMAGAPEPAERVNEHLLDGQQRLTALWRSLNDSYDDRTYFVYFGEDEDTKERRILVHAQARWFKEDGRRFPVWADDPSEIHAREYIPLSLLRPGDVGKVIRNWCDAATDNDEHASRELLDEVYGLRETVTRYNLPYLSLPVTTKKNVALDVFLKLNTSSVKLTPFDIIVAEVEAETDQSLHALVHKLIADAPGIDRYIEPENLILNVAAMREDHSPTQASYSLLDLTKLVTEWDKLAAGVRWMVSILEEECIFDNTRLPTVAVLNTLSALHEHLPPALDARGNALTLIRKYLWRAFFTRRYENAAATMALQDFRGLRDALQNKKDAAPIPIFNEKDYPLPTSEELTGAGWPKARDTLARAVLAATIRRGAFDLADGERATKERLGMREYHHLFPDALLTGEETGRLPSEASYTALNCALITWRTNRNISAKDPLTYLRERIDRADLGEEAIKGRLRSHLIPYEQLNVGGYAKIADPQTRSARIKSDYDVFLAARAELMVPVVQQLCSGNADLA